MATKRSILLLLLIVLVAPAFANYYSSAKMRIRAEWPASAGDGCGLSGLDLTGAGQLITTCDSGIDTANMETMTPDIKPNLVGFAFTYGESYVARADINGHGTHTAGSIVGTGANSGGQFKGMAYKAKLWAWMGGDKNGGSGSYVPYTVDEAFRPEYQASYKNCGMVSHIYSASYGSDGDAYRGVYGSDTARPIDEYCWNHPDFLPVWAAANSGAKGASTISGQGTAKNALVVGASGNYYGWPEASDENQVAAFSSRGPTKDGRFKPDVVSPGCNVISVRSSQAKDTSRMIVYDQYYAYMSGTSQATPLTAGMCALVREWLIKYRGFDEKNKKPSSALIKAIVMGDAVDIGEDRNAQGAGRTDLAASIAPEVGRDIFIADWIPLHDGEKVTYYLETTETAPFVAELVWVDYPGDATAAQDSPKLVNDLDLRVEAASGGEVWLGNGGTTPDRLNNTEKVHNEALPKGRYRIVVEGNNIPRAYEGAGSAGAVALYLRGAFDADKVRTQEKLPPQVYFR